MGHLVEVEVVHSVPEGGIIRKVRRTVEVDRLHRIEPLPIPPQSLTPLEFQPLDFPSLSPIKFLFLTTDALVTVRLNGQSDSGIDIRAGGKIALVNSALEGGISIRNNTTAIANISGVVGG